MSFRGFVTGSDVCAPSDGAGPSNAVGALVNTLLGSSSKTQEQLRELPVGQYGLHPGHQLATTPEAAAMAAAAGPSFHGGGIPMHGPGHAVDAFLHAGPSTAVPSLDEFEQIYNQGRPGPSQIGALPPAPALTNHLRAFLDSARNRGHAGLPPLPGMELSLQDKCRIRDRSTIMARHLYAEQGEMFAHQQVQHLLASLNINPAELPADLAHVHDPRWHAAWQQGPREGPLAADVAAAQREGWDALWQQGQPQPGMMRTPSTGWAADFEQRHHHQHMQQQQPGPPPGWVNEFAPQAPPAAWATEFAENQGEAWADELAQAQPASLPERWAEDFQQQEAAAAGRQATDSASAMQHTRKMLDVLSSDPNPKMRNSKFLQFLSKMSNGELILEDNKVVERPAAQVAGDWAQEFGEAQAGPSSSAAWAQEFQQQQQPQQAAAGPSADWADEFAKGVADLKLSDAEELEASWAEVNDEWAKQFSEQQTEAEQLSEWERIYGAHTPGASGSLSKHTYEFSANNPFLGDPEALAKGRSLFKAGVLSEAALALEAEVQANPGNADAWRLLGTVHAENDDDIRAIAAMGRALAADPVNLDVLLALGVSHTNELDSGEAVYYLSQWLKNHPQHRAVVERLGQAPDSSQALPHAVRLFEEAARGSPSESELHMALGVLHHLGRQYNKAVAAFEASLALRPQDYSLWNKLGATMANHSRSADAIDAYQKALDLKPNYMRAWTNMGISYANLGEYETSARFYVRALALNSDAPQVWSYLRTSLACAGRSDLMPAVDGQELQGLLQALPLE